MAQLPNDLSNAQGLPALCNRPFSRQAVETMEAVGTSEAVETFEAVRTSEAVETTKWLGQQVVKTTKWLGQPGV